MFIALHTADKAYSLSDNEARAWPEELGGGNKRSG